MKKNIIMAAIAATTMTFSSCGLGSGNTATTNTTAGASSLLGGALTGQAGSSTSLLGTVLGNLLKTPTTKETLIGKWTYQAPKVVFESNSILTQLGSAVASSKIESTLSNYLAKVGMTAGKSSYTFNEDGTCIFVLGDKTTQGTYSYDPETKILTLTGAFGMASLNCIATVQGNELDMVFDATKLLSIATQVSAASQQASTITSMLQNFSGLKLGWAMTR